MPSELPPIVEPPKNSTDWDAWRLEMEAWRKQKKEQLRYDGKTYSSSDYKWVSSCYSCNMLMTWDETFLDHRTGRFHVEDYLHEASEQFGKYDAVVLWQAYPRVGFDSRNQFDFYRELPGGLKGLREVVTRFHHNGVKVFIDYNPWDTGTRREGTSDANAIASVVKASGVDGIFLDTMSQGGIDMRDAVDRARKGVAFESEIALPIESLPLNHLSWAQWFEYGEVPGLLRNRWFEQRHMMHAIRRWDIDHTNELHLAWMNGAGILVWENVFGSWVAWSSENRELIRTMLPIQRAFTLHFSHGVWKPLLPLCSSGVYASEWRRDDSRLLTVVNRTNRRISGHWIELPTSADETYFDLISGEPFDSRHHELAPNGIAALIAVSSHQVPPTIEAFLRNQRLRTQPATLLSRSKHPMIIGHTTTSEASIPGDGMIAIPAKDHQTTTHFRVRECGERGYAHLTDSQYPGLHQDLAETRSFHLDAFAVSDREVTNAEYHEFLIASKYHPPVLQGFLKHWVDGKPPVGEERYPVVYVDLNDARAYAKWKGLRLPSEAEWQVAMDLANFPRLKPEVWNWTDTEYSDGRTRYCLIKGGSDFQAQGSGWYADGGIKSPDFTSKFIQIWPGLDRSQSIGFRCAVSLKPTED